MCIICSFHSKIPDVISPMAVCIGIYGAGNELTNCAECLWGCLTEYRSFVLQCGTARWTRLVRFVFWTLHGWRKPGTGYRLDTARMLAEPFRLENIKIIISHMKGTWEQELWGLALHSHKYNTTYNCSSTSIYGCTAAVSNRQPTTLSTLIVHDITETLISHWPQMVWSST